MGGGNGDGNTSYVRQLVEEEHNWTYVSKRFTKLREQTLQNRFSSSSVWNLVTYTYRRIPREFERVQFLLRFFVNF